MTEDEANQKQCCGPEGCGQHNDRPYPARWCVGSACMAWRSIPAGHASSRIETPTGFKITINHAETGYCGLAGRPFQEK